jgi:hypothetical protein
MTITPQSSNTAPPTPRSPAPSGAPHGKLILLACVGLVVLVGVVAGVIALMSPSRPTPRPAAHGTLRALTGTGAGTMTLDLTTGAAAANFRGQLSPLGAETGHDNLAFTVTGPGTFTYTGTRTFVAADGDELFSAITGTGTFTSTSAKSTETDTITGGTGRLAGASGSYTDTVRSVVVSATSTSQTSHFTAAARGQIRY